MNNLPFISKLKLKNYKNIVIEDKLCFNNLSILIGPNGCGKSNLIGIFRFLKDCLISEQFESDEITSFDKAVRNLGGKKILDRIKPMPENILIGFEFNNIICLDIKINIEHILILLRSESLYLPNNILYIAHDPTIGEVAILMEDTDKSNRKHSIKLKNIPRNEMLLKYFHTLLSNNKISGFDVPMYDIREDMIEIISKWHFYNANYMNVNEMRLSEPKIRTGDIFLSANCENLARVIYNLFQKDVDFDEKLNQAIKQILPMTKKVRAIHAGELSLTVEWHVEGMKEPFYLYEMSDGMVRMLCWAVMLHSPRLPSLLIIEEPEIGIHPAWMRILAEWIKSASERTQVIISTHSPDLLDHFTDRVEDVICFHFDGKSHFFPKNLIKEEVSVKLDEGWQLGDLYRVGHPFIGGWPW